MMMHASKAVVTNVVVLAWAGIAMAVPVAPGDYELRILEPPVVHPPVDCELFAPQEPIVHPCGAGPGYAGGIDNDGNIVGPLETNHPHQEPWPETIRWLRSTGYEGENMGRFRMMKGLRYVTGGGIEVAYPGPEEAPTAFGFIQVVKVTSDGIMYGVGNIGNGSLARYDIQRDEWRSMGFGGLGASGNNHGLMVDGAKVPGAAFGEFDSRVFDTNLVPANGPFGVEDAGVIKTFPPPLFQDAVFARDINDANIIVGSFEDATDGFPTSRSDPIKILPVSMLGGDITWPDDGFVRMDELDENSMSRAVQISNSDPPFAIGWSNLRANRANGVIWNVDTGEIMDDFGVDICLSDGRTCGLHDISPDGTMVVGARTTGFAFPGDPLPREHFIAFTEDGWVTHTQIMVADTFLESVPGGADIAQITRLTGINDFGQISAQGLIKGAFGQYLTPGVSAWDPAVATDRTCPDSDPGEWRLDNGCGIPLLLDTLSLMDIIKGDVNNDGIIDFLDITPFINAQSAEGAEEAFLLLTPDGCFLCADIDMDGVVDFLDITPYVNLLDQVGTAAVPEPTAMAVLAMIVLRPRHRRKR